MTKAEFRKSKEYAEAVEIIKGYRKGRRLTLCYGQIPKPKANALRIVTEDCRKMGILESIRIGIDIHGNFVEEEYRRL
jgi:hypothetical protein